MTDDVGDFAKEGAGYECEEAAYAFGESFLVLSWVGLGGVIGYGGCGEQGGRRCLLVSHGLFQSRVIK